MAAFHASLDGIATFAEKIFRKRATLFRSIFVCPNFRPSIAPGPLDSRGQCSHFVLMDDRRPNEADTIGLVAQLRGLCADLARQCGIWEVQLRRLIRESAQPELCGPERSYKFKVEQWDKSEDH